MTSASILALQVACAAAVIAIALPADAQAPATPIGDTAPAAAPAAAAPVQAPPAPVATAPTAAAPATASAAASPAKTGVNAIPAPQDGMGQVVFFRPGAYVGWVLTFTVHEGNKGVARFGNSGYQVISVPPGEHTFTVQSEATDKLILEVDPGETYYVRETVGQGLILLRPHMDLSNEAVFQSKALKLSVDKATDIAATDAKPAS